MDKLSFYNVVVDYKEYKLVYNTLTTALVCLTKEEFKSISDYNECLEKFSLDYPKLYEGFKKSGFIVDANFNELDYIKFMNNKVVYENQLHHIIINPTLDCNLRCWYCSTELAKAVHCGRMSDENVDAIKKHITNLIKVKRIPKLHLDWFGGEPLMYFNEVVYPIAKHAYELTEESDVQLTQHVTTNSVYMTDEMMERMSGLHFTCFQITLDGNERHHNVIKFKKDKAGTFRDIVNNLNRLPEIIPNVHITLRINYDKKTLYGIEDVIPMINDNARAHISVDFQKVWQITNMNQKDKEQLKKVRAIFAKNGFYVYYSIYRPKSFHRCYVDRLHQYAINYDGKIFKCTAQDYADDKVVGHLGRDGEIEWNNQRLSSLYAHVTFDDEKCYNCKLLPICMGPCIIKCKLARDKGYALPCIEKNNIVNVNEYIVNEARVRELIQ